MTSKKIYGKHIATYHKNHNGNGGLMDRTLEIYQTKTGLKGVLWVSSYKGWRENENNIISVAKFNKKDKDDNEYRVCEYFGGNFSNVESFPNYGTLK